MGICLRVATAFCAALFALAGQAATVTWTVTNGGEGHAVVIPTNAEPQMATILTQAKDYLETNANDTLVLFFPANTYDFYNSNSPAMVLNNFTNGSLVLSGAGTNATTLVFEQFDQEGIRINDCNNVTVQQMLLTRNGLYVTQGDVVSVTNGLVVFQVHPGFPDPVWLFNLGGAATQERTLIGYTHVDPLDPHLDPIYDKVELSNIVSNGVGTATIVNGDGSVSNVTVGQYEAILADTNEVPPWPVGEWVAQKCKTGAETIKILSSDNCVVQDVRITQSDGNGLRAINGVNGMVVQRVTIDRSPPIYGRAPCFSSPAGGPQIYCGYAGAIIQNCTIIATADDGIGYFPAVPPAISTNGILVLPTNGMILNNTVRDNQARGIVIAPSAGGICAGNTLERNDEASILLCDFSPDVENYTNAAVLNWTISDNAFVEAWVNPVIFLTTQCTNAGLHNDIAIVSNSFIEAPKDNNLVYVANSQEIQIDQNTITSFSAVNDYTANPEIEGINWNSPQATNALVYVKKGALVFGTNACLQPITNRLETAQVVSGNTVNVVWNLLSTSNLDISGIGVTNLGGGAEQISVQITNMQPGNICRFWKSTNLTDWQDEGAVFATNIPGAGTWSEIDTNQSATFYRASR